MTTPISLLFAVLCAILMTVNPLTGFSQQKAAKQKPAQKKRKQLPFRWVNPLPDGQYFGVKHATYRSPSMNVDVGYCIYLPPGYDESKNEGQRYPVVYYLHGGRPGNETKSVALSTFIDDAIRSGSVPPTIYVFVNGGEVSHYNYPEKKSMGEDVFVNELIPHVDKTYRTVADRKGRALEGFSQGGRGTTRIMFKHPHLFCSAAPGGAGHATEKRISENDGRESEALKFAIGYNTYDLARIYADNPKPPLRILIFVGTKGFNYENNLAYMEFLETLDIPFERLIVAEAPHSAKMIYEKAGLEIMKFHADNFAAAAKR